MDWVPWVLIVLIFGWAIWSYRNLGHEMDAKREKEVPMLSAKEADREDVRNRFKFHTETKATAPKHDEVISQHRALALWIVSAIPPCPERELALTALQTSMLWCNEGVAIRTEPEPLPFGMLDKA